MHTGWAVLVAVSKDRAAPVAILDRRLVEMIHKAERERPRFAYHAARELPLEAAERLVRECTELSLAKATEALRAAVKDLASKGEEVVASGIVGAGQAPAAPLEAILKTHSRIHAAEGELFRGALRGASEALRIPVTEIRAKDLQPRAAAALGIPAGRLPDRLSAIGRAAGRPWAKDHREACLAALIALLA